MELDIYSFGEVQHRDGKLGPTSEAITFFSKRFSLPIKSGSGPSSRSFSGDDSEAKKIVSGIINEIGFDPIDLGGLSEGKKMEPASTLFDTRFTKEDFR